MSDKKATATASGGIGFFGLLTIVLITLKLLKQIEISWWAIAAVFFAPIGIVLTLIGIFFIGVSICALIDKVRGE